MQVVWPNNSGSQQNLGELQENNAAKGKKYVTDSCANIFPPC